MNVAILVIMTGRELIERPYRIQRKMPAQNSENIPVDMSFVDLVFQVLTTCGRNEIVVRVPAAIPRSVTPSIVHIVPLTPGTILLHRCGLSLKPGMPVSFEKLP